MTEEEWLACEDPGPMLELIGLRASDRKLRLFQVACCRRTWELMPDESWRQAVIVAERYADNDASDKKRIAAQRLLRGLTSSSLFAVNAIEAARAANIKTMKRRSFTYFGVAAVFGYAAVYGKPKREGYRPAFRREQQAESQLVRDIFGNPFRPVAFNPAWRTSDVLLLARGIYEEKAFDRMPILADALQDAGCDRDDVLYHCRDTSAIHVRGCWVIDLVLGKK